MDIRQMYEAVRAQVIGREDESQLMLAALSAGRDLLLEGPPGTSKSTLLRAIASVSGTSLHFVEGNADLTPAKLLGHHSPARVLQEDYSPENFVYGPLPLAMREGGLLYIEEFNRVPEDTLNTLITAMAERELTIPRAGAVHALPGFRVVAAMNPFDNIGTARLSGAVMDRLCRVALTYQSEQEEREIVARRTGSADIWLVRFAVRVVRRTREHPDLRMGASVRAAIDFTLVADQLARLRGIELRAATSDASAERTLIAAAQTALSIKVAVRESARRSADDVVAELVRAVLRDVPEDDPPHGHPPSWDDAQEDGVRGPREEQLRGEGEHAPPRAAQQAMRQQRKPGVVSSGQVYDGEEAQRLAARQRTGQTMFSVVVRRHPHLAERLRRGAMTLPALEAALCEDPLDELEVLSELVDLYDRSDLRDLARRLARELIVRSARRDAGKRAGRGPLTSLKYRGEVGELDLERSLDALLALPHPRDEDLYVLDRRQRKRSYALMLDCSGSMKGRAIFHAALALAAFATRVASEPFAVVAFWREAAILKHLHQPVELDTLLDQVLALTGRGMTDVGLGLRVGLDELAAAATQERIGLLFSDGMQTVGEPAELFAPAFATLHVVATGESAESHVRCQRLAALGHGHCAVVADAGSITSAVNQCLAA